MSGEMDLTTMLASMRVSRRAEPVTVVTVSEPVELGGDVLALITEREGTTVVATIAEAESRGWPVGFVAAWLTVEIHSALEAVGLTAAMSAALGRHNIACNVLAGYHHDHLLVPIDRADDAIAALEALSQS
jgi:hypothetical protein